jgi:uncharacterized membrane protein
MILFGWLQEKYETPGNGGWLPFIFGCIAGIVPWVALAFYLLYALGTTIFVISPAIAKQSFVYALGFGALFGFFCYMTYDLTNLAVIEGFPARLAVIDIVWGAFITAVSASVAYAVGSRIS